MSDPEDFSASITEAVRKKMLRINAQRKYIIEAFIAETGCLPSECEQVEERSHDGLKTFWYVRRRPETRT